MVALNAINATRVYNVYKKSGWEEGVTLRKFLRRCTDFDAKDGSSPVSRLCTQMLERAGQMAIAAQLAPVRPPSRTPSPLADESSQWTNWVAPR